MGKLTRRSTILAASAALALPGRAAAQALERPDVRFAVGGVSAILYLPVILADRLGLYEKNGLGAELNDFSGGAASAQALVGGSVDFTTAGQELTFRMAQRHQDIVSVFEMNANYTVALAVRADLADTIKTVGDLRGRKIGVTGPGSSTQIFVQYILLRNGVSLADVTFVGVGTGPSVFAAIQNKQVDAVANVDPTMLRLQRARLVTLLVDSRGDANTKAVFGGHFPATVISARRDFIRSNPLTVQAVVNSLYEAQQWLRRSTPDQVADAVPPEFYQGDRSLYVASVKLTQESFSDTGYPLPDELTRSVDFFRVGDPSFGAVDFNVSATFDDRFAKRAAEVVNRASPSVP